MKKYLGWLNGSNLQEERFRENLSFEQIDLVYTREHLEDLGFDEEKDLGFPGEYPFTRGIHKTMYRTKTWTMRQFAGFGSPSDTNKRFKYLLSLGQTGLSVAFDMPSLMGFDADSPLSVGEVGVEGVNVSCLADMIELFDGINLEKVTVSMTVNATAPIIFAFFVATCIKNNYALDKVSGTIQNDMLKEFIAQKEWIVPPRPSVKLACDIIEFCSKNMPKFNPISISGYHIREAGATAQQELNFTLADGLAYVDECLSRGMHIDEFAPRLSFFFDVHNDFFEEIAKFRAARKIWARLMKEHYGAKNPRSWLLRTHAQTAGVSLTAQQPYNNIVRVALQALAAVLGGVQSLHTNSMDETLSLPTEHAVKIALRTQQIIAEETGVTNTVDPLGGSYYVEYLTKRFEKAFFEFLEEVKKMGSILHAVEVGYPQRLISESSFRFQKKVDEGKEKIVGVNVHLEEEETKIETHQANKDVERKQRAKLEELRKKRDHNEVLQKLDTLKQTLKSNGNSIPVLIDCALSNCTLGEIVNVITEVYGNYREKSVF
ncbi:MAG: methylmalonyl-CoA mutase family protein [Deltaproteobacteria bacterium]|nr:methylmalonyl-CoA mutase family protein [Deltaproteobacteria bacterium]